MLLTIVLLCSAAWPAASGAGGKEQPQPEKLVWGKDVNGLAVALSPAEGGKEQFVLRWKNVGQETLELQWVRFKSDVSYGHLDDLLNHVFLKGPDGKLVPARTYRFPIIGGPPYRPRTVLLKPGQVHKETIDLWTYVDKPAKAGPYQLWVEPNVKQGYAPSQPGARYWTGKITSNVLEIKLAK
jgi:hypothetical protein